MSKRWTDEDLKKLRPGMVADKNSVQLPESSPHQERCISVSLDKGGQEKGKTTAIQATGTIRESRMNKTEAAFAQELELWAKAGEIAWWSFEPLNLRLGVNCYYRVDFMVMKADGRLIAYEVKGHWEDDALVKIRTAAEKFPWPFIAVRRVKGKWEYRNF